MKRDEAEKKNIRAKTSVQVHICLQSHKENSVSGTGEITTIPMCNVPYARNRLCFVLHTFQHIQMVFSKIYRITKKRKKIGIDIFMEVLSYDFIK